MSASPQPLEVLDHTGELDFPNSTIKECPIAALPDFLESRPATLTRISAALINRDDDGVKINGQWQEFVRSWLAGDRNQGNPLRIGMVRLATFPAEHFRLPGP